MSINSLAFSRVVTAKVLVKPAGLTDWKNLGTLEVAMHDPQIERIDIVGSGKGYTYIRAKQPVQVTQMYSATATEKTPELIELSLLANPATDIVQAAGTALTATFSLVALRTALMLQRYNVTNVVVKNAANTITYVQDTDYDLDAGNGFIELIRGGAIALGSTINVTYNCPALTRKDYNPNSDRTTEADVMIFFQDSHADDPVETHTFYGQYFISANASQGSKEQQKWSIEFYPLRSHNVTVRDIT